MSVRTVFLTILLNGFLHSEGFFINSRDIRKFFNFIPTLNDFYRRDSGLANSFKERRQHKKYENSINEKLNKLHECTREKPGHILDYDYYEDSTTNEHYGHPVESDKKHQQRHYGRLEFERLQELDNKIKRGVIRLIEVKNKKPDDSKNRYVSSLSIPAIDAHVINSDYVFNNDEHFLQQGSFRNIKQHGSLLEGELDYFK
nr:uncharacterized protein LOC111517717 [Leptinotarsa decemlineata]